VPRLSDEQLAERARGLGATDVATAAGVNPYQTPYELYLTKIGELDPEATIDDAARARMERGHRLEDVALAWDRDHQAERTGVYEPYERVKRTVWHPRLPFVFCHPDARRTPWRSTRRLVEVKTSARPWKDGVPRVTDAQVQVQMACTGAKAVDVVLLTFDGPPERFVVERDEELIDALERVASAFWGRVERKDPPPMDGSAGAREYLNRTRWADEPDILATPVQRRLIESLIATRAQLDELEAEEARLQNVIQDTMAGSARLNAPGVGRIIWSPPYVAHYTKWKEVSAAYRHRLDQIDSLLDEPSDVTLDYIRTLTDRDDLAAVEQLSTTEKEARRFMVEPDERGQA
jgi:putative phage-type endonuclease